MTTPGCREWTDRLSIRATSGRNESSHLRLLADATEKLPERVIAYVAGRDEFRWIVTPRTASGVLSGWSVQQMPRVRPFFRATWSQCEQGVALRWSLALLLSGWTMAVSAAAARTQPVLA